MKQYLLNIAALILRGKIGQIIRKGFLRPCVGLSVLFLLMSTSAFASHFKGGFFSYNYLGEGRYEFLITGYWDKSEVGSIIPRYQGYPAIDNSPLTISKTLLEDGETVEHVQRQVVRWSRPGIYQVYWRQCCRGEGTNFGHNFMGLFAAVNYNPEAPSSSPQFGDERSFNFNSKQRVRYAIQSQDPDGHEQEFSLEQPYGLSANVYDQMIETGFQLRSNGTIIWEDPQEGSWLVKFRLREKIDGVFTGAYIDREIIINVKTPGKKPDKKGTNARNAFFAEDLAMIKEATAGVQIYPNPVKDISQLKVVLEEADFVKVDIIDLSGRVVKELYAGNVEAGEELSLEINSKQLGNNKLLIGRLISTKGVQTFRLMMQ